MAALGAEVWGPVFLGLCSASTLPEKLGSGNLPDSGQGTDAPSLRMAGWLEGCAQPPCPGDAMGPEGQQRQWAAKGRRRGGVKTGSGIPPRSPESGLAGAEDGHSPELLSGKPVLSTRGRVSVPMVSYTRTVPSPQLTGPNQHVSKGEPPALLPLHSQIIYLTQCRRTQK